MWFFKNKPNIAQLLIDKLPSQRPQPSIPFLYTGVDFCGPVLVRSSLKCGGTPINAYVAIIVCVSTKAIHTELVTGFNIAEFLASFKWFISWRGRSARMYSNNATNFVRAHRELTEFYQLYQTEEHQGAVRNMSATENTEWHFAPPRSPHFGVLWEAAVKSLNYHLRRVACLKSRTLTPLSSKSNDIAPLTPGHFLIYDIAPLTPGHFLIYDALTIAVASHIQEVPINRLPRWPHAQKIVQHF
ncbi:hypothetical protein PR048_010934 [Dryococelus australis]|uniref:Integrase catalytic domain-containing protein n=1 Tax=Dryococelus australis TaxID=614101 RepID=A0ABQ9HLF0_9NEOP|nr:hypothetical protein PR048_010934 [Dryococelus australis]